RRVCPIRLESPLERPEERGGFRHPNLRAWVEANRPRLLAAALTILRGYCAAGRPDQHLTPWGSFTGWSGLVPGAGGGGGLAARARGRLEVQQRSDTAAEAMTALLAGWSALDPHGRGLTAGEVVEMVYQTKAGDLPPEGRSDLRAALDTLLKRPDGRA